MRKILSLLIVFLLVLSLAACSNQKAQNRESQSPESAIIFDTGKWPENKFTEGLAIPSGTVSTTIIDEKNEYCSINIVEIEENEYNDYMKQLNKDGFSIVKEVSEEIEGQGYVSENIVLSDGKKWLSVSHIPNNLILYISFSESN